MRARGTGSSGVTELVLYTTAGCHLCEQAQGLLAELEPGMAVDLRLQDIAESEELVDRYGVRIPVLRRADGAELGWPFDLDQLRRFVAP